LFAIAKKAGLAPPMSAPNVGEGEDEEVIVTDDSGL
jgi:hypothetical protein